MLLPKNLKGRSRFDCKSPTSSPLTPNGSSPIGHQLLHRAVARRSGDAPFCRHRSRLGVGSGRNDHSKLSPHELYGEMPDRVNSTFPKSRSTREATGTVTLLPATAVRYKGNTAPLSQLPYIPERCCPSGSFPLFRCQNSSPIRFLICRWRCCRAESQ